MKEIAIGIDISPEFLSDSGLKQSLAKSTMSDGNAKRSYKVFEELYYRLIKYPENCLGRRPEYKIVDEIKSKLIKLVDATTMSLCLTLFSWAEFRTAKGGIKAHVSLDEVSMVPDMVLIISAKVSDRRGVDNFRYPPDTIVVDDRGYFNFSLFKQRVDDENIFVTRIKDNTKTDHVPYLFTTKSTSEDFEQLFFDF